MNCKGFLSLLLLCSVLSPALAQTTPKAPTQPKKPVEDKDDVVRITTNLVQVDAVVTKDGKPVTNLTADHFEIYEDGRKQTITSFAYISNVPSTVSQPVAVGRDKVGNLQVVITDKEPKSKAMPVVQWIDFEIVKSEPAAVAPGSN